MEIQYDTSPKVQWVQKVVDHLKNPYYKDQFEDLLDNNCIFVINFDELRQDDMVLFNKLLQEPILIMEVFEEQIIQLIKEETMNITDAQLAPLRLSFKGNLTKHTVTPRGLTSYLLNKLVMVQGKVN